MKYRFGNVVPEVCRWARWAWTAPPVRPTRLAATSLRLTHAHRFAKGPLRPPENPVAVSRAVCRPVDRQAGRRVVKEANRPADMVPIYPWTARVSWTTDKNCFNIYIYILMELVAVEILWVHRNPFIIYSYCFYFFFLSINEFKGQFNSSRLTCD